MKKSLFYVLIFVSFIFTLNLAAFQVEIEVKSLNLPEISIDKALLDGETKTVSFYLTVSQRLLDEIDDSILEELSRFYINSLIKLKINFNRLHFFFRSEFDEEYKTVSEILPKVPPVPKKEGVVSLKKGRALSPQKKSGDIVGALNGKTIFLSPGHGWVYNSKSSIQGWGQQRAPVNGVVEDDSNAEIVSYFLLPYLQNAGATVFSARETDRQENMVIVDNEEGANFPEIGLYEEGGSWSTGSGKGYGKVDYPIPIGINPLQQGSYRYAYGGKGAWAKWTPNIPADGFYHVYVNYKTAVDRAENAVYTINHAGGKSEATVNQQRHGSTWIDLGNFYFYKGLSPEKGSVVLNKNDEAAANSIIIADAVRFGGGKKLLSRGGTVSGKPCWEESATSHIQFLGAPKGDVYQNASNDSTDDVKARSRWAAWENEENVDDSIYLSWHSNASSGTVGGISTYIYSGNEPGGIYKEDEAVEGSAKLAKLIHNRILNSVVALFNPNWKQHGNGLYSAYFGELNPAQNPEMPSCLVEVAFHDFKDDAKMLKNPKFRNIATRAAYQAIVSYFAEKDGSEAVFLPENPINIRAKTNEDGSVTLTWDPAETDDNFYRGHPATGFIVQTSSDGLAFNDGIDVGAVAQFTSNFPEKEPVYFRVLAYNDGGISFPSVTAGAIPVKTGAQILVVDGFERIDAATPRFAVGDGKSNRYLLEFINSFNYVVKYAHPLKELGYSLDFTQKANIPEIDLSSYDVIFWFSGEQSSVDSTFTLEEQGSVAQFIADGGLFFVSGAEIGWDLVEKGNAEDVAFFNDVFNADFQEDSSQLYSFYGDGDFASVSGFFDDGSYIYQPEYPDVIAPFDGDSGKTILFYDSDKTKGAAVLTKSENKNVVIFGFPFETILDNSNKIDLIKKSFETFKITPKEIPDDENGSETGDGDSSGDENGSETGDGDSSGDENGSETGGGDSSGDENGSETGGGDSSGDGNGSGTGGGDSSGDGNGSGTGGGDSSGDENDFETGDGDSSDDYNKKSGGCSLLVF